MLYVAGMFTALYAATHITPWFLRTFVDSGNAFEWLRSEIVFHTHAVGLEERIVPALPTAANALDDTKWISLHVLQGMFTVFMAWAIFMLFVAVDSVVEALSDERSSELVRFDAVWANAAGLVAGTGVAVSTLWLLATFAWIRPLQPIAASTAHSVLFLALDKALAVLKGL